MRSGLRLVRSGIVCCWAVGLILGGYIVPAAAADASRAMQFSWVSCAAATDCTGWIAASGFITEDTPKVFEEFARGHAVRSALVALNSGGGSVNDAIVLGRRWRALGIHTTVGKRVSADGLNEPDRMSPDAACESMCVLLLLAGRERYVPAEARVKVHQIWLGDRADNAKAHSYSADDLAIVQRDIGRLVKYAADMGGTGELIRVMLSVTPWEKLHRLSSEELQAGGVTTAAHPGLFLRGVAMQNALRPVSTEVRNDDVRPAVSEQPARVTGAGVDEATLGPDHRPVD